MPQENPAPSIALVRELASFIGLDLSEEELPRVHRAFTTVSRIASTLADIDFGETEPVMVFSAASNPQR